MADPAPNCSALPNPFTPLAFLPVEIANELEVSRYLYVASLGAFIWDLLSNVPSDYKLLFKHKVGTPTIAYFVSRIASLAYIITSTVFQIGSVGDCQALQMALAVCFIIAVPTTSLLFFFRVRAVFNSDRFIVAFFALLWLAVLAGCLAVPFAIHGAHVGTTSYCINDRVKSFASSGIVVSAVNDTLVFFAISLRILHNSSIEDTFTSKLKVFWSGDALPALSRGILQSGQQYYLITVGWNILTMAMILTPSSKPVYRAMFTIPNVAIENAMACKVYRDIRFGLIEPSGTSTFQRSTRKGLSFPASSSRRSPRPTNLDSIDCGITVSTTMTTVADKVPSTQLPVELDLIGESRASSTYERKADAQLHNDQT